ncbi:MAG: hypothetical protein L6Q78_14195 [Bacteroidia bacterium]|nr:hypothetical protein [Bacteroidia bacterium]
MLTRFGFNGKELDQEGMGGGGSTYDYGFRVYNPNLGKFLSVDPLTRFFPFYSSYQYAGNKPIVAVDLDGLEDVWYQYIEQPDHSFLLVSTELEVNEATRTLLTTNTGEEIPKEGVVYTVLRLDNKVELLHVTQVAPAIGEKVKAFNPDLWIYETLGGNTYQEIYPNVLQRAGVEVSGELNAILKEFTNGSVETGGEASLQLYGRSETGLDYKAELVSQTTISLSSSISETKLYEGFSFSMFFDFSGDIKDDYTFKVKEHEFTVEPFVKYNSGFGPFVEYNYATLELKVGVNTEINPSGQGGVKLKTPFIEPITNDPFLKNQNSK